MTSPNCNRVLQSLRISFVTFIEGREMIKNQQPMLSIPGQCGTL